jgi:hypothetical protein
MYLSKRPRDSIATLGLVIRLPFAMLAETTFFEIRHTEPQRRFAAVPSPVIRTRSALFETRCSLMLSQAEEWPLKLDVAAMLHRRTPTEGAAFM